MYEMEWRARSGTRCKPWRIVRQEPPLAGVCIIYVLHNDAALAALALISEQRRLLLLLLCVYTHTQQQHVINALLYFFFGQLGVVVVGLRLSRKKSFLSYSPLALLTFICIYKTPFSFIPFDSFLSLMIITKHTHGTRKRKKYNHQPSRTGVCLHGNRQAQTMVNPGNNKIGKGKKKKKIIIILCVVSSTAYKDSSCRRRKEEEKKDKNRDKWMYQVNNTQNEWRNKKL